MLLRFDPFRDIDRLANEILGAPRVPQPMPMDCYRHGDTFFLHFDLPGVDTDTLEVTEENNTLTVRAGKRGIAVLATADVDTPCLGQLGDRDGQGEHAVVVIGHDRFEVQTVADDQLAA